MANTLTTRWIAIAVLVAIAFFSAYKFAVASGTGADSAPATAAGYVSSGAVPAVAGGSGASGAGSPACACCGSSQPTADGVTGEKVEGAAAISGDIQKIDVDVSTGVYNPSVIKLKAGVPAEITFANGSGCTGQVMSEELGFFEDISGGPKTVKLPALEPGEYPFYCGMKMVFGKIVVE